MASIFTRIWEMEDLRKRVLFTLGMLGVYRLGIFVPAPGIDRRALAELFGQQQNTLLGLYDMFSGGALEQYSVFFLGIMPYITASILMQLGSLMVPALDRIRKEGQTGQNRITQYTRYLTIAIAVAQSFSMAVGVEQMKVGSSGIVIDPGWGFRLMTILTMTGGSCFVMWLGEQMTERGIGNGSSIIITAGILARIPAGAAQLVQLVQLGDFNLLQASLLLVFMFAVMAGIVFFERGQRRVPIQYAKRVLGRQVYEGASTHLPLKVNTAGVVPPIFASSVLMAPATIGTFWDSAVFDWLSGAIFPGRWLYNVLYLVLVVFFSFFYTAVSFNPVDVAENLKKQGGYIPKVRPGSETAEYLDRLLTRLTAGGSIYLAIICIMPTILTNRLNIPFYFGGTGLMILVSVTLDTVAQIEAQLMTRHYDGLTGPEAGARSRRRRLGEATF